MVALRAFTRGATNLALVKELRARTAAPMKKCVEALAASADDVEGRGLLQREDRRAPASKLVNARLASQIPQLQPAVVRAEKHLVQIRGRVRERGWCVPRVHAREHFPVREAPRNE